ncbi:MAG: methyltransferase domain-containing protein [Prolixibacteraceae bacterium]|nr:methyltransferase domain-containing protein [Prolixibacteraceae bacterium]
MEQEINKELQYSDQVGFETLDSISKADRFNEWMFKTISADTNGEILEIGSGIGNISNFFVGNGFQISVSDMRAEYCEYLKKKFTGVNNFRNVYQIDIVDPEFDRKHAALFGKFDSVFALNIIEHVEDDGQALKNCLKLLKPEGNLVILVPAFKFLFNDFDKGLGHYRRYTKKSLMNLFNENKIPVVRSLYFNFAGIMGWWFSGKILQKKEIPSGQMKLYNKLVWIFKIIDLFTRPFMGLSVIISGKKKK